MAPSRWVGGGPRHRHGGYAMRVPKVLLAELVGTCLLMLGGPGSAILAADVIGVLGVSLAFGFSLLVAAYVVGPISGCHINPAVTLGMAIEKKTPWSVVPLHLVGQVLGAALGGGIIWVIANGQPGFSASANGTLIYVPFEPERRRLAIVSHAGTARTLPLPVQWYSGLRLAPNGQQAAVVIGDGINTGDIWLLDLQHANLVPFTRDRRSRGPAWSQDGKRLAFSSDRNGVRNVFVQPIAAGSSADQITSVDVQADASSWSPDGALVFHQIDPKTGTDVWMIRPGEKSPPLPLLRGPGAESQGRVSPDGRLLAFVSNQSGRPEVYLTTFPVVGPIGPVSQGLGANPRWAANGNELFFSREGQILSVRVQPGGVVSGAPQPAMPGGTSRTTDFDVFPDGSFIVITADGTPSAAPPLIVITGWAGRPVAAQKR